MNHRASSIVKVAGLAILALGTAVFVVATFPLYFGVCSQNTRDCWRVADQVQMVLGSMPVGLAILLFMKWKGWSVLSGWLTFAFIWIVISSALIYLAPTSGSFMVPSPRESLAILLPVIFLLISLGICWRFK